MTITLIERQNVIKVFHSDILPNVSDEILIGTKDLFVVNKRYLSLENGQCVLEGRVYGTIENVFTNL